MWNHIRDKKIVLPVNGPNAVECWQHIYQLSFKHPEVMEEMWDYCQWEKTRAWRKEPPFLYYILVSYWMRADPSTALLWHNRLKNYYSPSLEQIRSIFLAIASNEAAVEVFKDIYKAMPYRTLYATIVPRLCADGSFDLAAGWHKLLLDLNDSPTDSLAAKPLLDRLAAQGKLETLQDIATSLEQTGLRVAGVNPTPPANDLLPRQDMNMKHGETNDISPKSPSDSFCARLFATRFFSVSLVASGLKAVGANVLGPLALREVANRALIGDSIDIQVLKNDLEVIEEANISFSQSKFTRLVLDLASKGDTQLLYDIIRCDLHPDAFDDWKLQEALLVRYTSEGDEIQIRRTLEVILLGCFQHRRPLYTWNAILRCHITRRSWHDIDRTLEDMRENHIKVLQITSSYMRTMLNKRNRGHAPQFGNELVSIIGFWKNVVRTGGHVTPSTWIELLKRLGMLQRWTEMESLTTWLAQWYSSADFRSAQGLFLKNSPDLSPGILEMIDSAVTQEWNRLLSEIFSPAMQGAIIVWGSRAYRSKQHVTFSRGLRLLVKLKKLNVPISESHVRKVCKQRLLMTFNTAVSNRPINRMLKQDILTLRSCLINMEQAWDGHLFLSKDDLTRGSIDAARRLSSKVAELQEWILSTGSTRSIRHLRRNGFMGPAMSSERVDPLHRFRMLLPRDASGDGHHDNDGGGGGDGDGSDGGREVVLAGSEYSPFGSGR